MGQCKIHSATVCLTLESQDTQCMHNVRLWYVHITTVAVEMQQCILCVFHITSLMVQFSEKNPL